MICDKCRWGCYGLNMSERFCPDYETKLKGENMKKGDVVIANDLSWAKTIKDGKLVSPSRDIHKNFKAAPAVVIETNCRFPGECRQPEYYVNDMIVQVVSTGEIIFIHGRFLQPVTRKITFDDGRIVELSEQSYQNFRQQLIN